MSFEVLVPAFHLDEDAVGQSKPSNFLPPFRLAPLANSSSCVEFSFLAMRGSNIAPALITPPCLEARKTGLRSSHRPGGNERSG